MLVSTVLDLKIMNFFFISGTFHLIVLDPGLSQVTEATESETMNEEGLLYCHFKTLNYSFPRLSYL